MLPWKLKSDMLQVSDQKISFIKIDLRSIIFEN